MSKPITALMGAVYDGLITITETPAQGMITLRAVLSNKKIVKAISDITGCAVPEMRKITSGAAGVELGWMSPDELLLICDYAKAEELVSQLKTRFAGQHALVVNVSDARASFTLEGAEWRNVLGKLAPVELSSEAFATGDLRRTRAAQVPVAFWQNSETSARLVCFRSVARYVFDLLKSSAHPAAPVGWYRAP